MTGDREATRVSRGAKRYSSRAFLDRTVEKSVQQRIFEVAAQTASWCNTQPWRTFVVSGDVLSELARTLTAHAAAHEPAPDFPQPRAYNGVYADRRRGAGYALYEALGIARDDVAARDVELMKNYSFFGAPHTAIVTTDRDLGVFGAVDCGAYVANVLRAAHELDVQTIAQGAIALYPQVVRNVLQVGDDRLVVCAVSFGYADTTAPVNRFRTERAAPQDVVTFVPS